MYIADHSNHKIRKISPEGITLTLYKQPIHNELGIVTTIAGSFYGFADGHSHISKFMYPRGVSVDSSNGDIYVADSSNHRIRKITATGTFIFILSTHSQLTEYC